MVDPVDACLSPDFGVATNITNRPHIELANKTNSSLSVDWDAPQWQEHCQKSMINHPPLTYVVNIIKGEYPLSGYPLVCFIILKHLFKLF